MQNSLTFNFPYVCTVFLKWCNTRWRIDDVNLHVEGGTVGYKHGEGVPGQELDRRTALAQDSQHHVSPPGYTNTAGRPWAQTTVRVGADRKKENEAGDKEEDHGACIFVPGGDDACTECRDPLYRQPLPESVLLLWHVPWTRRIARTIYGTNIPHHIKWGHFFADC